MKITYKTVLSSLGALQEIQSLNLPPSYSLALYKNIKILRKELETYDEVRQKLDTEFQEKNADYVPVEGEVNPYMEQYQKDVEELVNTEMEVAIKKIDGTIFERFNINHTTQMLAMLDGWLLDIPEDTEENENNV